MKQVHAALRLLICLLLIIAWGKPSSPASPRESAEAAAAAEERTDHRINGGGGWKMSIRRPATSR